MKCSHCGVNEASVHVLEVKGSQKNSYWLCPRCAAKMQGATPGPDQVGDDPFAESAGDPDLDPGSGFLLGQLFELVQGHDVADDLVCPACGMVFRQFRETNQLGCSRCYDVFRAQLRPLLTRYQSRLSHIGRLPGDGGRRANPRSESIRLRIALEEAVAREDFEEAAQLRDRLRQITTAEPPADEAGKP